MTRMETQARVVDGTLLMPRWLAAKLVGRHPDQIRRRCKPVDRDPVTKALLYDFDAVEDAFRDTPRRCEV